MRKTRLYIETSVWNFLFAEDAPDKMAATKQFFTEVSAGKYEIYISDAVTAEIAVAPEERRSSLFSAIEKHSPVMLEMDDNVKYLAGLYIQSEVLSAKHYTDLLHMAFASANGLFALISWNLSHLVKMKTYTRGNAVNLANGFPEIQIFTPQAVIEDED